MEGEFGKIKSMPESPASVIGGKVYRALSDKLPAICSEQKLNSSSLYKNATEGLVIDFSYLNGKGLSDSDWAIAKETAQVLFDIIIENEGDGIEASETISISFIDSPEPRSRKIVIKESAE